VDDAVIHSVACGAGAGSVPELLRYDCLAARCQGQHRHNAVRAEATFF